MVVLVAILLVGYGIPYAIAISSAYERGGKTATTTSKFRLLPPPQPPTLDKVAYDKKLIQNANYASTTSTTTPRLWPAKAAYPNVGALLPAKRIIAYYGNFYSTRMGILGEFPREQVIAKLKGELAAWNAADPTTPTIAAIDYIAVTAQVSAGKDGKYRLRMPDEHIDRAVSMANELNGIVILEVQTGLSTYQSEIPALEKYLKMPNVHLALDPEFNMKGGEAPGTVIGSVSAADVNYVIEYLAQLVRDNNLPPKVLIIHRFTQRMVTGYESIRPLPEVQVVIVMDGWGSPARKISTYKSFIAPEPVQFTGFKIFYKNDLKPPSTRLLTPAELLKLTPQPVFIQYQ